MLKPHYFLLLLSLLADGGTVTPPPSGSASDAGTGTPPGPTPPRLDGGTVTSQAGNTQSIHWPDELQPMATLDGPAVLAAHAALQHLLARFPKEYSTSCSFSAKAMEVVIGKAEGLYFVRIDQHVDRCGWAAPGFTAVPDWFELYAVTPDGRVLARYPYSP